jgi:hypothetical protein
MAKIIRCPNCGENVEVPPNPTGQIVTCIACGTAMRLKSKKDAGERKPGDSSQGSLSGSLSGSMSATRITSDTVQASSDDPPDLGSTCDVCGRSVDPSELTEDRGKLACRDCIKGARSSRPRALKGASDSDLIPFSSAPDYGPRRAGVFTFGMPFFVGLAALAVYIGCSVLLAFNPKPVGTTVNIKDPKADPPKSTETKWDVENLPVVAKMMEEANTLKADPNRLTDARQKYEAVVAFAKGQEIGSQEMRGMVDRAEQEAEALRVAAVPAPPPAPPPDATVAKPPGDVVPDSVAPQANSVFDDPEVQIADTLNNGVTSLEGAISAPKEAADAPAQAAILKFSEARGLLIREKRNVPDDPGWALANHGTAVGYLLTRNYPLALEYLDRLPASDDRATILNRVVCLLQMRENKADAITLLINHLSTEAHADDGYALNLLGTTLARYPVEVIKQDKSLADALEKYNELVKKLAPKHPGEKRWGARWIGINEWNAKDKERRIQLNRIEELNKGLLRVQTRIGDKQKILDRGGQLPAKAQQELSVDRNEEVRLKQLIETERAKIPPEEWLTPEQIVPVLPDVTAVNTRAKTTKPTTRG